MYNYSSYINKISNALFFFINMKNYIIVISFLESLFYRKFKCTLILLIAIIKTHFFLFIYFAIRMLRLLLIDRNQILFLNSNLSFALILCDIFL